MKLRFRIERVDFARPATRRIGPEGRSGRLDDGSADVGLFGSGAIGSLGALSP